MIIVFNHAFAFSVQCGEWAAQTSVNKVTSLRGVYLQSAFFLKGEKYGSFYKTRMKHNSIIIQGPLSTLKLFVSQILKNRLNTLKMSPIVIEL